MHLYIELFCINFIRHSHSDSVAMYVFLIAKSSNENSFSKVQTITVCDGLTANGKLKVFHLVFFYFVDVGCTQIQLIWMAMVHVMMATTHTLSLLRRTVLLPPQLVCYGMCM